MTHAYHFFFQPGHGSQWFEGNVYGNLVAMGRLRANEGSRKMIPLVVLSLFVGLVAWVNERIDRGLR